MNDQSCDYDIHDIELDPRFKRCRGDAFFTLLSYLGMILLTWILGYALSPADVSEMQYWFGFPRWYTVCTLICVAYSVVGIIWAIRGRKFTLDARGSDEEVADE